MAQKKPSREHVISRAGNACEFCGSSSPPFEVDHIWPTYLGGSDSPENLQLLCVPCHDKKSRAENVLREVGYWAPRGSPRNRQLTTSTADLVLF